MGFIYRGGGGGASSIVDLIDHEFADRTARDAFYTTDPDAAANLAALVQGETVILVLDNGSGDAVIEIWVGPDAPMSYENTNWADITSAIPSASVIKTLYESNANTNALVDSKLEVLNALSVVGNELRSSLAFVTTPTSISFGVNGARISSSGQAMVFSGTDASEAFILTNAFTAAAGSANLTRSRLTARQTVSVQSSKAETSASNPVFTYTVTATGTENRRHTDQLTFETADTGMMTYVMREGSASGPVLRLDTVSVTADTETSIDLDEPVCLSVGTIVHVTITGGIRLKGLTVSSVFQPFLSVRAYLGYDDGIVTAFTANNFAANFRDALQTLTDDIRLDASAIKNLPQPDMGLSLLNSTGSQIPRATPVVIDVNVSGDLLGVPATSALLEGVDPTDQQNRIYGFTTGTVNVGASFTPVINGSGTLAVDPEPSAGTTVWVEILSNGNLQLTTEDLSGEENDRVYGVAGYVTTPNAVSGLVDVYLSSDLVDKSRADRISRGFEGVISHTATGVQNFGGDLTAKIHTLASTVTAFDLLSSATFRENELFAIVNGNTSAIEFDVSALALDFGGDGSGDAYNIPGNSTMLFYILGSIVYPLSGTATTGAGGSTEHPVVLTRNTPSLTDLASLAAASLNGNSGLWVVASNQLTADEDLVDNSIMIRSLNSEILDANGAMISTTAVQKNGGTGAPVLLAGGTIVRVFSSTDLRVVSGPLMATSARYPDLPVTGTIHINSQSLYNTYRNRTLVYSGSSTIEIRLFQIQLPSAENITINYNDVFCFRQDGTGEVRVRTFQVGTIFSSNQLTRIDLSQGELLCVSPNMRIGSQTPVFTVVQQGQATDLVLEDISNNDWYRDAVDATAANNAVRIHNRYDLVDGLVRDHIRSASHTSNPITLAFQRKNYQDSIAWIQFWSVWDASVPPLGTDVSEILANIPTSLSYIQSNINNGFDFQFNAPDALLSIEAITNDGGNSFRIEYEVDVTLPTWFSVNDEITIAGASNAGNNGTFAIDSIATDRRLFNITNASGVNESGSSAYTQKTIYADAVLVAHDVRQTNFNLYEDAARTSPQTINSNWFDPDYTGVDSVLAIGYNTDVDTITPYLAIEDDNGDFFSALGGPRGGVHYFDNTGAEYQNVRYLPINFSDIHIRTDGTCDFFLDIHPEDLPPGQKRTYSIYSHALNDNDDVDIGVGRAGGYHVEFDEGISFISIQEGTNQVLEIYNDGGGNSGVRLNKAFQKYAPSASLTSVTTPTGNTMVMGVSVADIVAAENEDPNFSFMSYINNKFNLKGRFRYQITYRVKLRFDGSEDTGLSFVNVDLVPTRTRSAVTTDITRAVGNNTAKIDFVRNGNNSDDNTKPIYTLTSNLSYFAEPDDQVGYELRFGTFPSGYSVSDIRIIERQYTITVTGGIR